MRGQHYWITSNISVQNSFQKSYCFLFIISFTHGVFLFSTSNTSSSFSHLRNKMNSSYVSTLVSQLAPSLISSAFNLATVNHRFSSSITLPFKDFWVPISSHPGHHLLLSIFLILHASRCEVISHCGLSCNIISLTTDDTGPFFLCLTPICMTSEICLQILCPFLNWVSFLYCSVRFF